MPEGCKQKTRSEEFVINTWQQKCLEQYQSLKGSGKEYVVRELMVESFTTEVPSAVVSHWLFLTTLEKVTRAGVLKQSQVKT